MSQTTPNKTIDIDLVSQAESIRLVELSIRGHSGGMTQAELVISTGLSVYQVQDAVEQLVNEYHCVFKVDTRGDISYHFDFDDQVKKRLPFKKRLIRGLRKVGLGLFKGWVSLMLVFYLIYYFPVLFFQSYTILVIVILTFLVSVIPMGILIAIGDWMAKMNSGTAARILHFPKRVLRYFNGRNTFLPPFDKAHTNLIQVIFEYIFGQPRPKEDKLGLEKRILRYVAAHGNQLTVAQLIAITGWGVERAEKEINQIMLHYHAEVEVTEHGVLVYHFPQLESASPDTSDLGDVFVWNNLHPILPFNRNYPFENGAVTIFNLLVLVLSLTFLLGEPTNLLDLYLFKINVHLIPLVDVIMVFLVKAFGHVKTRRTKRKFIKENRYYLHLKSVLSKLEKTELVGDNALQDRLIKELLPDYINSKDGTVLLSFDQISHQLKATDTLHKMKIWAEKPVIHSSISTYEKQSLKRLSKFIYYHISKDKFRFVFKQVPSVVTYAKVIFYGILVLMLAMTQIALLASIEFVGFEIPNWLISGVTLSILGLVISKWIGIIAVFTNTVMLDIDGQKATISTSPIPKLLYPKKFELKELENIWIENDNSKGHMLLLSSANIPFAVSLIRNTEDFSVLKWVRDSLFDYYHQHITEGEVDDEEEV